ncbi:MAG: LURP-one-related family protein [Planctomycetota bacterium]
MYQIKEKMFTLGSQYVIRDADGEPLYHVQGKVFSWGDSLSFQDNAGSELATIEQKLLSWKPRYRIYRSGELYAEVVKEWTWINRKFTLDVPGPNDYTIDGDFWNHEYTFRRGGRVVAHVSKAFWSWADTYGVQTIDGEDDQAILVTCIVIDLVCDAERNSSS